MPTKPRRHLTVKVNCKYCGTEFDALLTRIREGRGEFCSIKCSNLFRSSNIEKKYVGYENACKTFDKVKKSYYVYWIDQETGKRHTTSYPRWWWETHVDEVPENYRVGYKDGNTLNIDPENFYLQSPEEFGSKISKRLMGHTFSDETLKKMSEAKNGKKLSEAHKQKIGKQSKRMWAEGVFDDVHFRENNYHWRGGVDVVYPPEFNEQLKNKIWERDNYSCRACKKDLRFSKNGEIHHIDGQPENCVDENLILLCVDCHKGKFGVHYSGKTNNDVILVLRRLLPKYPNHIAE